MTRKQVARMVAKDDGLQEALDALIHEHHSQMASNINNNGPEAQLEWLEENIGDNADSALRQIKPQ